MKRRASFATQLLLSAMIIEDERLRNHGFRTFAFFWLTWDVVLSTSAMLLFPMLALLPLVSCHSSAVPAAFAGPGSPPPELYRCWAGGFAHLPAGNITLAPNGHYESYRPGGGGRYAFSPDTSAIEFINGDYHYWEYRGIFQRAPQSRDHKDSIVLLPLNATTPIGAERPGEYQYCYLDSPQL